MQVVSEPDRSALLERLKTHRTIGGAPTQELQWIATNSEFRTYDAGDIAAPREVEAADLMIVLSGRIAVTLEHGTGTRHTMESRAGGVTGVLPYSRMGRPLADAVATEPTEVLTLARHRVPELIRECPTVTGQLVHVMLDRARHMTSANWQDEKTMSLGRLAAGLAHELNNPASSASRSASVLRTTLRELGEASRALGTALTAHPDPHQADAWLEGVSRSGPVFLTAMERADREEELHDWLTEHRLDPALAGSLVQSGLTVTSLDQLSGDMGDVVAPALIRWVAAEAASRGLLDDVERATSRIHDLVAAVKRFTYLDRSMASEATDVAAGLSDTLSVWRAKAEEKSVVMQLEVEPGLPPVRGNAGLLNQAWSNLLENAIDAAPRSGRVTVSAGRDNGVVTVRFVDNGPGIPAEVRERMFDPFFTTKPVGQGIGLGLDIVRRVVQMHDGSVEVSSQPGRTELSVTLQRLD